MNGHEIFAHTTNTFVNQEENNSEDAEEFLEELRDSSGEDYEQQLERAILYFAGFNAVDVSEVYE